MCKNPNLEFVNMNAYIKFVEILPICSQDIKRKRCSGVNEGLDGGVWYSLFIKNLAHYSSH